MNKRMKKIMNTNIIIITKKNLMIKSLIYTVIQISLLKEVNRMKKF